jgi:hypothetical protein
MSRPDLNHETPINDQELRFKKGYGYWDVTKYPYGGDFNRFDGNEIGVQVSGPVKLGNEIRVKLNDGRTIVVSKPGILNNSNDDELEGLDEMAGKNLKDVIINIPDEHALKLIKNTSALSRNFSPKQLAMLQIGNNELTVNHYIYSNLMRSYPEGAHPFGTRDKGGINENEISTQPNYRNNSWNKPILKVGDKITVSNLPDVAPRGYENVKIGDTLSITNVRRNANGIVYDTDFSVDYGISNDDIQTLTNKFKHIGKNEMNEIDWDRAADRFYSDPYDIEYPDAEVTSLENGGYDEDNFPQYDFSANYGYGTVSSLEILRKLAGWEFTSGCESKNPSIIKICDELENKLDNYYNSFPVVKPSYGGISKEDWKKFNEYIKEVYSHDIVTKIIETELNMGLANAIEKLLDKGLIDFEENRGFREPD